MPPESASLERAVALTQTALGQGADALILNKFGKHEAEGRGFRDTIVEALARDIPVIVGLDPLNRPAFDAFTQGLATPLAPELAILATWLQVHRPIHRPSERQP